MRVRLGWCAKGHKIYTGEKLSGKMKLVFRYRAGRGSFLTVGRGRIYPSALGRDRPCPSGVGRGGIYPSTLGRGRATPKASGETETSPESSGEAEPPQRRRARRRLALSPRARQSHLKGVRRGGTKLLSFEQGTLRRPYPSRSFYRSVVIGSTFWGTPVLGPRQDPS